MRPLHDESDELLDPGRFEDIDQVLDSEEVADYPQQACPRCERCGPEIEECNQPRGHCWFDQEVTRYTV